MLRATALLSLVRMAPALQHGHIASFRHALVGGQPTVLARHVLLARMMATEPTPGTTVTLPGYKTTYTILKAGNPAGPTVTKGSAVTVHATGVVVETGKTFWSTKDIGQQPFSYTAGVGMVITGWDQGLLGMAVGEERMVTIPAAEGYGAGGFVQAGYLNLLAATTTENFALAYPDGTTDSDNNGYSDFAEWAMGPGAIPAAFTETVTPPGGYPDTYLLFRIPRNGSADGVTLSAQASNNLAAWSPDGLVDLGLTTDGTREYRIFRSAQPLGSISRFYVRAFISRP